VESVAFRKFLSFIAEDFSAPSAEQISSMLPCAKKKMEEKVMTELR
jgi:hypothetical protein